MNLDVEGTMWRIKNLSMLLTIVHDAHPIDENVVCAVGTIIEELAQKAIDD